MESLFILRILSGFSPSLSFHTYTHLFVNVVSLYDSLELTCSQAAIHNKQMCAALSMWSHVTSGVYCRYRTKIN